MIVSQLPGYPYTVTPPSIGPLPLYDSDGGFIAALPFVSKLDPTGAKLLFSVPVGGGGVQLDSSGNVYVGGGIGSEPLPGYAMTANLPALAAVPSACLPNQLLITNSAYVAQVDGASGDLLNTQFIGGDALTISGVALSGSVLWVAGGTDYPDLPFTPNALTVPVSGNTYVPGAYLGAVDFSHPQPPAGTPQISCVLDGANLGAVGPAEYLQLLTIFGSGLGPAAGVAATDNSTTRLAGVEVDFGGVPAPLLYVSSNQINFAVPALTPLTTISPIQVTVAGASSSTRALPITATDASLFLNYSLSLPVTSANPPDFIAFVLNADGSENSPANPASLGSTISAFVNGLVPDPNVTTGPLQIIATPGWTVSSFRLMTPYVYQVNLQLPSAPGAGGYSFSCPPGQAPSCPAGLALYYTFGFQNWTAINSGPSGSATVYVQR